MVTLDQGQWPRVMSTKGNAPGSNKQKTLSKNIKRLSQYTQNSWNPIAANANVFECCISFWEECKWEEPGIIFHYYKGPLSNGQKTPLKKTKWFRNGDQNSETPSQ